MNMKMMNMKMMNMTMMNMKNDEHEDYEYENDEHENDEHENDEHENYEHENYEHESYEYKDDDDHACLLSVHSQKRQRVRHHPAPIDVVSPLPGDFIFDDGGSCLVCCLTRSDLSSFQQQVVDNN